MATVNDFSFMPYTSEVVCATLINTLPCRSVPPKITKMDLEMSVVTTDYNGDLGRSDVKSVVEGKTGLEGHIMWVYLNSNKRDYRIYIDDFNKEIERLRNEKV